MLDQVPRDFEAVIEGMAHGGSGVARWRRHPVFVPYTIPGERIVARLRPSGDHTMRAEGLRLLEASADRVLPRCPHFGPGRCWRCQWQHIDYPAQLLLKQDVLADQLERLGGIRGDVVKPLVASPSEWGYNHHMVFTPLSDGQLGLPAADGRTIISIDTCLVLHPRLLALYEQLDLSLQDMRRVKLQIGSDGAPMVILYLSTEDAPELETDLDASVNVLLPDNEPANLIGESHSRYQVLDRMFRVTAGSAYRANAQQVPNLVKEVQRLLELQGDEYVLDLYAGVGVFGAFLAQQARLVTLVESYPPAATDAESNLADLDNVDVIEGSVEDVLSSLDGAYDCAVVDPSASVSDAVMASLAELGVKRLIYVSSDPGALARDCKRLGKAGYRLEIAQPFDCAPQTYHVDTVALFTLTQG
jgi:23S rRNA (uracil1939-C5)-methyltransferase